MQGVTLRYLIKCICLWSTFWYLAANGHFYQIKMLAVFLMGFKVQDPILRFRVYWKLHIIKKLMSDFHLSKTFLSFWFKKAHLLKFLKNQSLKKKCLRSGWFLRVVDMIRKCCLHRLSIIKLQKWSNPPAVRDRKSETLLLMLRLSLSEWVSHLLN